MSLANVFRRVRRRSVGPTSLRSARLVSLSLSVFLLGGMLIFPALFSRPSRAQEPTAVGKPSKEVQDLIDQLQDIDALKSLNPLKLTPEQMDKLANAIIVRKAIYDKQVVELGSAPFLRMADEIHEVHKKALLGTDSPKAFDERVQSIQNDFLQKRDALNADNIKKMTDAVTDILESQQAQTAIKLEEKILRKIQGAQYNEKTKESALYHAYVVDIFINYPRIVPLLREMKASSNMQ